MVLYKCFRCGYNTTLKGNMKHHLNRKNICNPVDVNVSIEEIKKYYGFKIDSQMTPNDSKMTLNDSLTIKSNDSQMTPNDSQMTLFDSQKTSINSKNEKCSYKYNCRYCGKIVSKNSNLHRHEKICKKKKESEILVINQNEEIVKMKKESDNMKKEIEELKEKVKYKSSNNITNKSNNNITNNITNNTININNHGEENIEHLSEKYLLNLFTRTYRAIPLLIEKIYFDPEHPENQNIKLTNKKLPYIKIKKNNKWQFVDRRTEVIDLIDAMCFILSENYQNMTIKGENNLNERQRDVIDKYLEKYRNDDKKFMKELENIVDLTLINNS